MTDPASFDDGFDDDDLRAFRNAALQLSTCDPLGIGDPDQPGLLYHSGGEDPDADGWMWTDFAHDPSRAVFRGSSGHVDLGPKCRQRQGGAEPGVR